MSTRKYHHICHLHIQYIHIYIDLHIYPIYQMSTFFQFPLPNPIGTPTSDVISQGSLGQSELQASLSSYDINSATDTRNIIDNFESYLSSLFTFLYNNQLNNEFSSNSIPSIGIGGENKLYSDLYSKNAKNIIFKSKWESPFFIITNNNSNININLKNMNMKSIHIHNHNENKRRIIEINNLRDEITISIIGLILSYTKLSNQIVLSSSSSFELDDEIKISNLWNKSSSFILKARNILNFLIESKQLSKNEIEENDKNNKNIEFNPLIISLLKKLLIGSSHLLILHKSLYSTTTNETKPSLMSRIGIFALTIFKTSSELSNSIIKSLSSNSSSSSSTENLVFINGFENWLIEVNLYLKSTIEKFLSLDYEIKNELGKSITLINLSINDISKILNLNNLKRDSLYSLFNKKSSTSSSSNKDGNKKVFKSINKFKKNTSINDNNYTSLNLPTFLNKKINWENGLYYQASILMSYLIDYEKIFKNQNDKLTFQKLATIDEVMNNWPSGREMPFKIEKWFPIIENLNISENKNVNVNYTGRGAYY